MTSACLSPASTLAWLHDLSPYLLRISGDFGLRWYGLAYAAGFLLGYLLLRWLGNRGASLIPPQRAWDAIMIMVIGVIAGGRIGYVLVYEPSLLTTFTNTFPWWGLLQINKGGMASHGGIIGVVLACCYISRGFKDADGNRTGRMPVLHVLDLSAMLAPAGLFLGRIANFINGELLGKIVAMPGQPAPWWAVRFPQERLDGHDCSALMEPAARLAREQAIAALTDQVRLPSDTTDGAYHRLLEKIQSGNQELANRLEPLISARHPSQLYQALAEGLILGAVLWFLWKSPRKPGVVGAAFMIVYGLLRIATEFYRLPDAHLAVQRFAGLSRGQWLSAAMVVIGVATLAIASRRKVDPIGGWGMRRTVAST
ncbi:MAG: prolipoprotein diacylglyceryl transferase [Phycisphaerales bacterium]|nr:prolipoprotein diacylglyceryl transferase [Phycisphaerales bacterium]